LADARLSGPTSPVEQLLGRPLGEATLDRNTEAVARLPSSAFTAGETLLFFTRCSELFALPAMSVLRAFPPLPVHRVPHRPGPLFRGVASDHGELRLVGSLEAALDLAPMTGLRTSVARRMLLVDAEDEAWLFEADSVVGVHRSRRETWMQPPSTISQGRRRLTTHVVPLGMRRAALVDASKLVSRFREAIQ